MSCVCLSVCPVRPPSPLIDPVRERYTNQDKLVEDFEIGFLGPDLADVVFIVGMSSVFNGCLIFTVILTNLSLVHVYYLVFIAINKTSIIGYFTRSMIERIVNVNQWNCICDP